MRRPGWNQRTRENPTRPLNTFYGLIRYTVVPPNTDRHKKPTASKEDWITTKNACVQHYVGCHYTRPGAQSTQKREWHDINCCEHENLQRGIYKVEYSTSITHTLIGYVSKSRPYRIESFDLIGIQSFHQMQTGTRSQLQARKTE